MTSTESTELALDNNTILPKSNLGRVCHSPRRMRVLAERYGTLRSVMEALHASLDRLHSPP